MGIKILMAVAILFSTMGLNAYAGDWMPYSEEVFEQSKAEGKTIVLDFHASWCPICKKQRPILESLLKEPGNSSVVGLMVDFDNSTELKKSLKVQKQSTIVVFKGRAEVGRNMGNTNKEELRALVAKGL